MYIKKKISSLDEYTIIFIILLLTLIMIMLHCFSKGILGNDFWWHIKVGEYIVNNKEVPITDIFSWIGVEKGIEWTAHEWLSDVVFYILYKSFGEVGIFIFTLCLAFLFMVLIITQVRNKIKDNVIILGVYLSVLAVLTSLFFYGRPHIFSYFFLFFVLKILYAFYEDNNDKRIYLLPFISILWSNFHGGSANLIYILCCVFLVEGIINVKVGRLCSKKMTKLAVAKLSVIIVFTVMGILVNPIGIKVLCYPYKSFGDELMMSVISEWQAPDAKLISHLILFFMPIIIMTIGFITENNNIRMIDFLIMGVFIFLFFRSIRFIVLWNIAAAFYSLKYIPCCKIKKIKNVFEKYIYVFVMILLIIPIGIGIINIVNICKNGNVIEKVINEDTMDIIVESSPERIFNDYNLGEALIFNDIPVFFDARADLFAQEHIMEDGISMLMLKQLNSSKEDTYVDVDSMISKYKIDYVLILKVRPLYSFMINNTEKYDCVYENDEVAYFKIVSKEE